MPEYSVKDVVELASKAGKVVLENGGEIYRVEQTMSYICMAYGILDCECFAAPTMIIISVSDAEEKTYSKMLRITSRTTNLEKVAAVNDLSRSLSQRPIPIVDAAEILNNIDNVPSYSFLSVAVASSIGVAAFTIVFGGGIRDFLCGIVLGALLRFIVHALKNIKIGDFTANLVCGAFAAIGGYTVTYYMGVATDWWIITLSVLMLLVPGLLFTNALRDIAAGDLVSGVSRTMEAFSIVTALACGSAVTYTILVQIGGPLL